MFWKEVSWLHLHYRLQRDIHWETKEFNCLAQTWSNYKHNNIIKYLVWVTPGLVTFLSSGWGGRVSDKQITSQSGFLKKLTFADLLLADRAFNLHDEIASAWAVLKIPCFTKGKSQLSQCEVDTSRQLSNVCIHVEKVIGRLKKFRYLETTVPIQQVDLLDNVMIIISGYLNLNQKIV